MLNKKVGLKFVGFFLPRGRALRSRTAARLYGRRATGTPSAARSRSGASAPAAAATQQPVQRNLSAIPRRSAMNESQFIVIIARNNREHGK